MPHSIKKSLQPLLQLLMSMSALSISWLVLYFSQTSKYALQFFCAYIAIFFIFNLYWRKKNRSRSIIAEEQPLKQSWEISLVAGAIFLLVGSTQGLNSFLLPLYYIYFFFAIFVNSSWITWLRTICELTFLIFFTPDFGPPHYSNIFSLAVFITISYFAQQYYQRALKDNLQLQDEKQKVSYYNMYAEKKQNELLTQENQLQHQLSSANDYLTDLITQVDKLQTQSRFAYNQLIISAGLTKVGLLLRRLRQSMQKDQSLLSTSNNNDSVGIANEIKSS